MSTAAVVPFAALALLGLVAADERLPRLYAVVKPLATAALFLLLAPLAGAPLRLGIGAGLAFATLGDALLLRKADPRFFAAGMAAFALAHGTYGSTLLVHAEPGAVKAFAAGLLATGLVTGVLLGRLKPLLPARLRAPVVVYGVLLTGTVAGATAWLTADATPAARGCLLAGALLLYAGDAFYAFNRFVSRVRFGQSIGLVPYWAGQLALVLGVQMASA